MFRMQDLTNEIKQLDSTILPDIAANAQGTVRRCEHTNSWRFKQVPGTQGSSGTSFAHMLRRVDDLAEELQRIRPVLLPLASKCPAWSGSAQAQTGDGSDLLLGKLQQVLNNTEELLDNAKSTVPKAEHTEQQALQPSLLEGSSEQQPRVEPEEQPLAYSSQQLEQQLSPETGQSRWQEVSSCQQNAAKGGA